jgi:hypothetical protein
MKVGQIFARGDGLGVFGSRLSQFFPGQIPFFILDMNG